MDHKKLKIKYPCLWLYKVIGVDQNAMRQAVAEILSDRTVMVTYSNSSSGGKYHCLNIETVVHSEEDRTAIYISLKENPCIRIVL